MAPTSIHATSGNRARTLAVMGAMLTAAFALLLLLPSVGVPGAAEVQAAQSAPVQVQLSDGPMSVVAQMGSPIAPRLFGATHFGSDGLSTLVVINPEDGSYRTVGPIGFERCNGLDFASDGTLYGACERSDGSDRLVLVTIDTATGGGTEVGPLNVPGDVLGLTDISFRQSDDTLFAYVDVLGNDVVGTIDVDTGAFTSVGDPGTSGLRGHGIGFWPDDTLYHSLVSLDDQSINDLHTIDTTTGASSLHASHTYPGGLSDPRIPAMDYMYGNVNPGLYAALVDDSTPGVGGNADRTYSLARVATGGTVTVIGPTAAGLGALAAAPLGDVQIAKSCHSLIGDDTIGPVWAGEATHDTEGFLGFARPNAPATTPAQKVIAGMEWICTIDVFNPGAYEADALNVVVTDTIPADVIYSTDTLGDCNLVAGAGPNGEDLLVCDVGDLQPSENVSFDIEFVVDPGYVRLTADGQGSVTNEAELYGDSGDVDDFNNWDDDSDVVNDRADLSIWKMSKPDMEVNAGEVFTYTIVVENRGPSWSRGVYFTDDIISELDEFEIIAMHDDPRRADECEIYTPTLQSGRQVLCTLNEPLEPFGRWGAQPVPGTGRWRVQLELRANQTQDVNNVVRVFTGPNDYDGLMEPWVTGTVDPDPTNNTAEDFIAIIDTADLEMRKVDSPDPATAGELLTYSIRVTNTGPSTATQVEIKDNLPYWVEVVSIDVSALDGDCVAGTPGDPLDPTRCVIGEMIVGESNTMTVQARVSPDVPVNPTLDCDLPEAPYCRGRIFNDAWVEALEFDPDLSDNLWTEPTDVQFVADLQVFKSDVPDSVPAGEYVTYNVVVNNAGPSTARAVFLRDTLPPEVELVSAQVLNRPGTCDVTAANQVICDLGDIVPGTPPLGQVQVFITVRVKPDTPAGTITNQAMAFTFQTYDSDSGNNSDSEDTTVTTLADLEVEKASIPAKVYAGEQVKYVVTVTNHGPSDAENVVVTDALPAGTMYEIDTDNCVEGPAGKLTCSLGDMPVGAVETFAIWAYVLPDAPVGAPLENTAVVDSDTEDPDGTNNSARARTLILGESDLKIRKFGKPDGEVRAGDILTYTLIIDNLGPSWATGVAVKDLLQSSGEFDLLGIESDRPMACESLPAGAPGEIPGISERLQVDCVLVDDPATPDTDESWLEVLAADGPPNSGRWLITMWVRANETQDMNNVATVTNVCGMTSAPAVTFDGSPGTGAPPDTLGPYTMTPFADDVQPEIPVDSVPAPYPPGGELEFDPALTHYDSLPGWSAGYNGDTYLLGGAPNQITLMLPPGTGAFYFYASTNFFGTFNIEAIADDGTTSGPIPVGVPTPPEEGARYFGFYAGPCRTLASIVVTAEGGGDIWDPGLVIGRFGIAPGERSGFADPNPDNNEAYVEHDITDVADLGVTKTAVGQVIVDCDATDLQDNAVTAGLLLNYQMIVTNYGPSTAENVVLMDRLPPGVTVLNAEAPDGGSCETGTAGDPLDRMACGLGTIAVGDSKMVNVTVRVDSSLVDGTVLENDVYVASDIFDDDNANNHATNLSVVNTWADLAVEKEDEPDPVIAGELIEYTVTVRNDGPSDARAVVVTDVLDPDVSYVGFRDPHALGLSCSLNPIDERTLTCALGYIAAGTSKMFTIVGFVDPNAATPLDNFIQVDSDTQDACLDDNESGEDTNVDREEQVYIEKTDVPDPVMAGTELVYTVRFGNNGPSTAQDVEVYDTLPLGVVFDRCESLDPNDQVSCQVISGDGVTTPQVVRLRQIRIANVVVFEYDNPPLDELDPGEEYRYRLIADVESGYVLNGRGDTGIGDVCRPFFLADGYPYYAHNRIDIVANVDDDFDDECTKVESEADVKILKVDDLAGFLECDPVAPGGMITYDVMVTNDGASDAAQVYVLDWLPRMGVAHWPEAIEVDVSRGEVLQKRDDGRITILAGNDPNHLGENQLGRMNAGLEPVHIQIRVPALEAAECSSEVENYVSVQTLRNDTLWPPFNDPATLYAPTPTYDPDHSNNEDYETTSIECVGIEVDKTISFTGECPGSDNPIVAQPGKGMTFCFEITNTGTVYLDWIALTDTLKVRTGEYLVFTDTIRYGGDENSPVAPGETVYRDVTLAQLCGGENCECGIGMDMVEVTAMPVNVGRTPYPCLPLAYASDSQRIDIPCAGVDTRIALPALATEGLPAPPPSPFSVGDEVDQALPATNCESWIQVQNVGDVAGMAAVFLWGEAGYCPPQAAGPLKIECSGLLRPGAAWSFAPSQLPSGAQSGMVYSLSLEDVDGLPFGHRICYEGFFDIVGDYYEWTEFDAAYRNRRVWNGFDFGAYIGPPLAVTVNRTCPDPVTPNASGSAAYAGVSTDALGVADPYSGGYMYYTPMVFADHAGLNSWLHLQNVGVLCTSLEVWFKAQDNCLRPVLGDVLSVSPGETVHFDPNTVVGPDWLGSVWIRSSQPLAIVVDTIGANHFTSYNGVPGDVWDPDEAMTFSLGTQVNYAPLIYNQHQSWDTALVVQNLSSTTAAKAKVYFLDRSGGIEHTMVDWICPRGSQTFFLPVIDGLPGNWVGSARVESQEWWTPGDPLVDPPRLQTVVLLEKWSDPARTERREAVAYNAETECDVYNWQIGAFRGGLQSGSAVLAVPLVAKDNRGITTELAITNLVPKPGKTDFAIFLYDQNGLLDYVCEALNEKQVEYIDLASWGFVAPHFMGSAVVSAVFWEHDVFDRSGGFTRNLVGLGGVIVERIGGTQGQPDVPGDESKAVGMFPVYDFFHPERAVNCPGVPPMVGP